MHNAQTFLVSLKKKNICTKRSRYEEYDVLKQNSPPNSLGPENKSVQYDTVYLQKHLIPQLIM